MREAWCEVWKSACCDKRFDLGLVSWNVCPGIQGQTIEEWRVILLLTLLVFTIFFFRNGICAILYSPHQGQMGNPLYFTPAIISTSTVSPYRLLSYTTLLVPQTPDQDGLGGWPRMVWLKQPCDVYAWGLPFTRTGWGSLAGLVLTFGGSATRSVFTDGEYSTLGFYIFVRGEVGYSLVWCFCPRV